MERKIALAETAFKWDTNSVKLLHLVKLKYELSSILTRKAEFSLFRLRNKQFEEGDKAGEMLARYIKIKEAQNVISAIRTQDGHLEPYDINNTFWDFYISLYSSEMKAGSQEILDFLSSLSLPSLSKEQIESLDAPITKEEIAKVVKSLP